MLLHLEPTIIYWQAYNKMRIYLFRDNKSNNLDSKILSATKLENLTIEIFDFNSSHMFIKKLGNKENALVVIVRDNKNDANSKFLKTLEELKKNIKVKTIELCTDNFLMNNNMSKNNFLKDSVVIHGFKKNIWMILMKTIKTILTKQ